MPVDAVARGMSAVSEAPLERLAREADPETVAAFVAGLFEARGVTAERRGQRRVAVSSGGDTVRYAVVHPGDPAVATRGADRLVVVGDTPAGVDAGAADVVGIPALGRQLAYAVDREDALALLETHFGWSPDPDRAADTGSDPGAGVTLSEAQDPPDAGAGGPDAAGVGRWQAVVLAVVVAGALVGGAVALSGVDDAPAGTRGETGPETTPATGTATSDPEVAGLDRTAVPAGTGSPASPTDAGRVLGAGGSDGYRDAPPGILGPSRVNIHQFAGAFWRRLDNSSYRLSLTYRELRGGRPTGVYTETLRVESNTRYRTRTSRLGTLRTEPLRIAGSDLYANGTVRFERGASTVDRSRVSTYDPFMVNTTRYVGWFFTASNVSIADRHTEGNTTTYHLVTTGDPDPRFETVRGSAFVTGRGLVRSGHWEYTPADHPDVRVVFRLQVAAVGSTEVTAPPWVPAG
jgi:hypothetical protein